MSTCLASYTEKTTTLFDRPIEALLLLRLVDRPLRFGELADALGQGSGTTTGPSDQPLVRALVRLTADGTVRQRWSAESDSRVFELTERGRCRAHDIARIVEEALDGHARARQA